MAIAGTALAVELRRGARAAAQWQPVDALDGARWWTRVAPSTRPTWRRRLGRRKRRGDGTRDTIGLVDDLEPFDLLEPGLELASFMDDLGAVVLVVVLAIVLVPLVLFVVVFVADLVLAVLGAIGVAIYRAARGGYAVDVCRPSGEVTRVAHGRRGDMQSRREAIAHALALGIDPLAG